MKLDLTQIDDVIHSRLRLGIMVILSDAESATFAELKEQLGATDGNLSVQLQKLEGAGYICLIRRIVGRKTETRAELTREGREAFAAYAQMMSALIGKT